MDPHKEDIVVTPEEQKLEEEALKGAGSEDELREKLADEYGLDPEEDKELLDKLTKRELGHREKLSGAIKQKINYREKLKTSQPKQPVTPEAGKPPTQQETFTREEAERIFNEKIEQRDLEELNLPDEIQTEVKNLAKLKGISVRKAAQDPYILYKKEELEKAKRIEDATPKRKGRGSYAPSFDPSKPLNPADFDLSTAEGRAAWNDAKAARQKQQAK